MYLLFTCRFLHSRLFFFQNSCRFTRRRSTLLVVITHIHSTHKFHDVYLDVLSARLNLLLVQRVYAFRAERNAENQSWKTVLACWTLYYLPALERFSRIGPKPYLFYFIFPGQIVNDWRGKKKKKYSLSTAFLAVRNCFASTSHSQRVIEGLCLPHIFN